MRSLWRSPWPLLCAAFLLLGALGPLLLSEPADAIDLAHAYELPSAAHPLGTTDNGVDLARALIEGARLAALISLSVVGISLSVGALLGALSGLVGGLLDQAVGALTDLVQAFPATLLNIALLSVVARPGVLHIVLSLSLTGWVLYARLARAEAKALREREFVTAARALGLHPLRVFARHVLPNLLSPLVVQATLGMSGAILMESTLSFLGLGPANAVSWGALLDQGTAVLLRFPHVALLTGGVIAITVLAFNLTGDLLRDALDPRMRGSE